MNEPGQDNRPKKHPWAHLIVSNLVLLVLSAGLLAGEWYSITQRQIVEIGEENRFLTTEWYLLQQLRLQTDKELSNKDQEIMNLKRLYQQMTAQNEPSEALSRIAAQLKIAEIDRDRIVLSGLNSGLRPRLAPQLSGSKIPDPLENRTTIDLLKERLLALELLQEHTLSRAKKAEAAFSELQQAARLAPPPLPDPPQSPYSRTRIMDIMEHVRAAFQQVPPADLVQIRTISLVRAILSSPELRVKYPGLLQSFDAYLERYGRREFARGQANGYGAAVQIFQSFP